MPDLTSFSSQEYCYLTTTGRRSGRPHEIEIWFGVNGGTLYLLSGGGGKSDWVRNLKAQPQVSVRIAKQTFAATARLVTDAGEEQLARQLLAAKYYGWREGKPLNDWARTALPVALDINATP